MKKAICILSLIIVLTYLTACTSVKVSSEKNPAYSGQLNSIVVVTEFTEKMERFETSLSEQTEDYLSNSGMNYSMKSISLVKDTSQVRSLSELAGEGDKGAVMLISLRDRSSGGGGVGVARGFSGGTGIGFSGISKKYKLYVEIFDKLSKQTVWEAEVTTKGDEYTGQKKEGRNTAKKIMEKLVEDGIVSESALAEN